MRIYCFLQILIILLFAACTRDGAPPPATQPDASAPITTIKIEVTGLHSQDGKVVLALFSSADGFPDDRDKALRWLEMEIDDDRVTFLIEDVSAGRCAVSVFHDENANDKMETDFFGRPEEGYGFSRNAKGRFGPPSFEDAAIDVSELPHVIRIDINYN
ncbi:MAG: DUF2141 domain-containing protein [Candidatus Latescibacterota bacterium]|nr:MAG: DUF2141 domain-containing protein [Candidatus Latescibacterota bacterium]